MSKYNEVMEKVKVSKDMRDRILSGVEKEMTKEADTASKVEMPQKISSSKIVSFRRYAGIAAAFAVLFIGTYAVFKIRSLDVATSTEMMVEEASMTTQGNHHKTADSATAMMEAEATEAAEAIEAEAPILSSDSTYTKGENATATTAYNETAAGNYDDATSTDMKEYPSLLKLNAEAGTSFKEIQYLDSFSSGKDYYLYDGKIGVISYDIEGNTVMVRQMSTEYGNAVPVEYLNAGSAPQKSKVITAGGKSVTLRGSDDLYMVAEWSEYKLAFQLESTEALTLEDMQELMEQVLE